MTVEWAEFEIRRLPGVYACFATPDEVAVLVEPGGDTAAVTESAAIILQLLGIDQALRVLDGGQPVPVRPSFARKVPVAVGVGGLVAVALAGTVAALTGSLFGAASPPARAPVIPFAAAPAPVTVTHQGLAHFPGPHLGAVPGAVAAAVAPTAAPTGHRNAVPSVALARANGAPLVPAASVTPAEPTVSQAATTVTPAVASVPVVIGAVVRPGAAPQTPPPAAQPATFASTDIRARSKPDHDKGKAFGRSKAPSPHGHRMKAS